MTDIYKEQKDEVEIRINQLKKRKKKKTMQKSKLQRIYNTNKRTCSKCNSTLTNIVIGESCENLKVVFAILVLVCF